MNGKLAALLLAFFCSGAAHAVESIRCDGKIIEEGVSLAYVLALCGAPEVHVVHEVPARARNRLGFTFVSGLSVTERVIYDRGSGKFPAELRFVDGTLRQIEYLRHRR